VAAAGPILPCDKQNNVVVREEIMYRVHLSLPSVWRSRFSFGRCLAQTPATALTGLVSSAENNAMEGVLVSASKRDRPSR
jgi:hypothetical protein